MRPLENEQERRIVIFEIDIYVTQTRVYALFIMKRLISQSNQTKLPLLPSSWCECAFGEWSSPTMYSESENAFPPTPVSFARSAAARTAALRRSFASSFSSTDESFSAAKDGCAVVNPMVVATTSATPEVGRILRTSRRLLVVFVVARSSSSRFASLPLCLLCCLNNTSFPSSRVTSAALVLVIPPSRMGERFVRPR